MSRIRIERISITDAGTDCIVNAANEHLMGGSGVCGAIFQAAGWNQLQGNIFFQPARKMAVSFGLPGHGRK